MLLRNLLENLFMSFEQVVDVPENGQITVQLPSTFVKSKQVKLIINNIEDTLETKIALLKKAPLDKDFLSDLREVNSDFQFAESNIEE